MHWLRSGTAGGTITVMNTTLRGLLSVIWLLGTTAVAAEPGTKPAAIPLIVQTRGPDGACLRQQVTVDPARTAVVVIDMWDRHWCTTYTARVGNLVPRMNQTLDAARKLGIQAVEQYTGRRRQVRAL